jgi:hypothetical protein
MDGDEQDIEVDDEFIVFQLKNFSNCSYIRTTCEYLARFWQSSIEI